MSNNPGYDQPEGQRAITTDAPWIAGALTSKAPGLRYSDFPQWYMYPPKRAYTATSSDVQVRHSLASLSGPLNLYFHVPFCTMKCSFCTLFTMAGTGASVHDVYTDYLVREAELVFDALPTSKPKSRHIYIGGGTPSVLSSLNVEKLFKAIRRLTSGSTPKTTTIEFSPDTADSTTAALWCSMGATSASLGVQYLDDAILKKMNRRHSVLQALSAIEILRRNGFSYVNVDLIYGAHIQTLREWRASLERTIASGATRITIYPLAIEKKPGLKKMLRNNMLDPFEDDLYRQFHAEAMHVFANAGWIPTGALAFSVNGEGNYLEENEAQDIPTLGIGLGARSYLGSLHSCSSDHSESFLDNYSSYKYSIDRCQLPVRSFVMLDDDEQLRRRMILGLAGRGLSKLALDGLPVGLLRSAETFLIELQSEGLVFNDGDTWSLTIPGKLFAADVGWRLASENVRRLFFLQ